MRTLQENNPMKINKKVWIAVRNGKVQNWYRSSDLGIAATRKKFEIREADGLPKNSEVIRATLTYEYKIPKKPKK